MEASELNALVDAATARLAEKAAAEKAQADAKIAVETAAVETYKKTLEPAWKGGFSTKKLVGKNSKDEATDALLHYIRTGDMVAVKSQAFGMDETADSLGLVVVPPAFYDRIIGVRNQRSWARRAGLRSMTVGAKTTKVPFVSTASTEFVVVASGVAFDEDINTLANREITVYKHTKIERLAEELLSDQQADLESFIAQDLGEKMALTESHLIAVGTGSSQPYGILPSAVAPSSSTFEDFNDTDSVVTFTCTGDIIVGEMDQLYYKLNDAYAENSVWLMSRTVLGEVRALRSATFPEYVNAAASFGSSAPGAESFMGRPVFTNSNISGSTVAAVPIAFFDPSCYMLVDAGGLSIRRLDELFAATGEVGIRAHYRQGGAPVQMAGFVYGQMAAA